ncbi:MAG: asparagine synthase (glutamine-hydrolyzing) [Elusimicrobiota bacterium]
MCSIAGFYGYRNAEVLRKMNQSMFHRGPDDDGFYESENCSLAMRRLSIIDLKSGSQPYFSEDGSVVAVFNGEIYNFSEIKKRLESKGHRFKGFSDGEVLVHLYEEYGEKMFSFLRGMFAFAIYDLRRDILFAARDHFGIKPLFYFEKEGSLFFASELKALRESPLLDRKINPAYLDDYFTFLYGRGEKTIYENVRKLPAASYIVKDRNGLKIEKYWSFTFNAGIKCHREFFEEVDFLLGEAVKEQLVSDVPLGIFLSGGMDSSSILYYASKFSSNRPRTFTVSYEGQSRYDEGPAAKAVAASLKAENIELKVRPDIEELITFLSVHLDEPFADSSVLVNYFISREARKYIKVALSGLGGDEVFAGYPRYLALRVLPFYQALPGWLKKINAGLFSNLGESYSPSNFIGRLKRFVSGCERQDPYLYWISFLKPEEKKLFYSSKEMSPFIDHEESWAGSFESSQRQSVSVNELIENPSRFDFENYLEGDLLYLADMASMAASLELRVPFLDLRLVEKVAALPLDFKLGNFRLKNILKKIMKGRLPSRVFSGKMGFQVPLAAWFAGELREFAGDMISSSDGSFYDKKYAMAILDSHLKKKRNNADLIYAICALELWLKNEKR